VRVVLDTNTLVSGIISSGGPPRRLLDGARMQAFESYSSAILLAELLDVLSRDKFARRLQVAGLTPQGIVVDLRRLVNLVDPADVPRVIPADPRRRSCPGVRHRRAGGTHRFRRPALAGSGRRLPGHPHRLARRGGQHPLGLMAGIGVPRLPSRQHRLSIARFLS